ncbi:MAG: GatB/YqeY domain-containing protein [Elusimicrobiota bacterium]|jgi:hypothetical protein
MDLQVKVSQDLLTAMKQREAIRVSTLRLLKSAIGVKEIERTKTLSDGEVLEVIQSEAKRRREAAGEYKKANRLDLSSKEEAELAVLQAYLPAALSEAELLQIVQTAIASIGAKGPQDMGKVMSTVMPQIKGRADGKMAQQVVQQQLSDTKS